MRREKLATATEPELRGALDSNRTVTLRDTWAKIAKAGG
jgi:hypothetical protein